MRKRKIEGKIKRAKFLMVVYVVIALLLLGKRYSVTGMSVETPGAQTEQEVNQEMPAALGTLVVKTWELNVRETPNGTILGTIAMDEVYDYYEDAEGWLYISYKDGYGYVAGWYCEVYDIEGNLVSEATKNTSNGKTSQQNATAQSTKQQQGHQQAQETKPTQEVVQQAQAAPTEEELRAQLCQQVLNQVTYPGMSATEIVTAVNQYLCSNMVYDRDYYTTIDALTLGKGRCQGYANAFKSIMTQAGIPTDYVRGYVHGEGDASHAWNRVLIDGVYYCVDVTWNDSTGVNNWLLVPEAEYNSDKTIIEYNPSWTEG